MFIGRLGQRGDTIVEVLVAIAVVSLILGGAFVTTNKSLMATRTSEEQSNAVKLTQGQIELLKSMIATSPNTIQTAPTSFCISSATTVATSASAACKVDSTGSQTTAEPIFNLAITRANDVYTVRTTWNSLTKSGANSVQMVYRIYD